MATRDYSENQRRVLKLQGLVVLAVLEPMLEPNDEGKRRSLESLAREMGVSGVTLGHLQRGKRVAGRVTITQLSRYMDDEQRRLWLHLLRLFDQEAEDMREHLITFGREIANSFYLPGGQVQAALA